MGSPKSCTPVSLPTVKDVKQQGSWKVERPRFQGWRKGYSTRAAVRLPEQMVLAFNWTNRHLGALKQEGFSNSSPRSHEFSIALILSS